MPYIRDIRVWVGDNYCGHPDATDDLNKGHGGQYIQLIPKFTNGRDASKLIEVRFFTFNDNPSRSQLEDIRHILPGGASEWRFLHTDLNKSIGGNYIFMATRYARHGERRITGIQVREQEHAGPSWDGVQWGGWEAIGQDLCEGAGKSYIYIVQRA